MHQTTRATDVATTEGESPRIAGRYAVHSELGRGGMAVVYQVNDAVTGRDLALKQLVIAEGDPQGKGTAALFEREFHTLAELSHPRIIEVYDYGVADGMVGRDEALAELRVHMERAFKGHGRGVIVAGAPGTGRSRVLDACVLGAKILGATVLRAGAKDQRRAPVRCGPHPRRAARADAPRGRNPPRRRGRRAGFRLSAAQRSGGARSLHPVSRLEESAARGGRRHRTRRRCLDGVPRRARESGRPPSPARRGDGRARAPETRRARHALGRRQSGDTESADGGSHGAAARLRLR